MMASPGWFFSTLSQSIASITGFIITLTAVLYQLEHNERKSQANDLRNSLMEFEQKYSNSLYQVMALVKEPFGEAVPHNLPESEELDVSTIQEMKDEQLGEYPTASQIWLSCHRLSNILEEIAPSENPKENYLLTQSEMGELQEAIELISGKIMRGEETVLEEVNSKYDDNGPVSVRQDIFENTETNYIDLDTWFSTQFPEHDDKHDLEGENILSILNYFQELERDIGELSTKYNMSGIDSDSGLNDSLPLVIALTIVGVFLPIASLATVPEEFVLLSGIWLTIYELVVLVASIVLMMFLLFEVIARLPIEY